jgi:hypothetical protein
VAQIFVFNIFLHLSSIAKIYGTLKIFKSQMNNLLEKIIDDEQINYRKKKFVSAILNANIYVFK